MVVDDVATTVSIDLVGVLVPMPTKPALVTTNSVVVAEFADVDAIANKVWFCEVDAARIESVAYGVEVPIPTLPLTEKVVLAMREVDDAKSPCLNQIGVSVAFTAVAKVVFGVNGNAAESPAPVT